MSVFSSVLLDSITVNSVHIHFDKPDINIAKAAFKIEVQTIFEDSEDENAKFCNLNFSATVTGKLTDDAGEPDFDQVEHEFNVTTSIDYSFEIVDRDSFSSLEENKRSELCSNLVYLDFRRRVIMNVSSIGITNFRIPLSLSKLQKNA
ncbi:TPA: hypothetical protein ACS72N_001117 [Providencia alcalifaciens]